MFDVCATKCCQFVNTSILIAGKNPEQTDDVSVADEGTTKVAD